MKKILFQIANYSDRRQDIFEQVYSKKTQKFANLHGYEYHLYKGPCTYRNCSWQKIYYLNNLIETKKLVHGDRVLFLDADVCIKDINEDYPFNANFNYSIDNGNTHCMGIWGMVICDWTISLINNFMNNILFDECNSTELWKLWSEQGAWYTLTGIPRHSWKSYFDIEDYGWGKTEDDFLNLYPLAYNYMSIHKTQLMLRDKGKISEEKWFLWGRTQGINNTDGSKIIISPIYLNNPFTYINQNVLVYSGYYIISESYNELFNDPNFIKSLNFISKPMALGWKSLQKKISFPERAWTF